MKELKPKLVLLENLIFASEAKNIARKNANSDRELEMIFSAIKRVSNYGGFGINYSLNVTPTRLEKIVRTLADCGYHIKRHYPDPIDTRVTLEIDWR